MSDEIPRGPAARRKGVVAAVQHAVGAFTRNGYETDKHVRELVKIVVNAGIAVVVTVVLGGLLYVGMTRLAGALDGLAKADLVLATEVRSNLDEQRIVAAMERISKHYQPQVQEPKLEPEPASAAPKNPRPKR